MSGHHGIKVGRVEFSSFFDVLFLLLVIVYDFNACNCVSFVVPTVFVEVVVLVIVFVDVVLWLD